MKLIDWLLGITARSAVAILGFLPLRWAAHIGRAGGNIMYYLDGRHRRVAIQNLTLTFGDSKTSSEIRAIAQENFKRIGENFCCAAKSAFMDNAAMEKLLEVRQTGSAAAAKAITARNIIFASGHFGNFELLGRISPYFKTHRHATTYRGIRQPVLENLLCGLRSKSGLVLFERRRDSEPLKKELNSGGLLLILFTDQSDRKHGLNLPFLGRPAFTNRAPAIMASRYECSIFAPVCYRRGLANYCLEIGEPIPTHDPDGRRRTCEAITRDINAAHEAAILRDPANWFWVHNRWKQQSTQNAAAAEILPTRTEPHTVTRSRPQFASKN